MPEIYNNDEIVEKLIAIFRHTRRTEIIRDLDVSKQSLSQFEKQQGIDINNKIISVL